MNNGPLYSSKSFFIIIYKIKVSLTLIWRYLISYFLFFVINIHPCNISRNQENIMRWFFINDEAFYKCCETFLIICKTQDSWMNSPTKVRVINSNEICKLLAYTETNFILSLYTHRGNKYVVYIFNCCYEVENEIAFKKSNTNHISTAFKSLFLW